MTVTNDQILRGPVVQGGLKLEFAWGGNLTQRRNASGSQVAQIVGSPSFITGYPAQNVIDGSECSYNLAQDLDNDYWASTSGGSNNLTIYFGSQITFNQIVVYNHFTLPSLTAYSFYGSNDGVNYTLLQTVNGSSVKDVVNASQQTWAYLQLRPGGYGSDNTLRIVEIQVFNWVDVTSDVVLEGESPDTQPEIHLTAKGSSGQNAMPTPSELQIELNNAENKYSPWNTKSPYYGITGPDGLSSDLRTQARVRLQVSPASANGSFTQQVYYGIIAFDDNPGGAAGFSFDDAHRTVTIICKSIMYRLDSIINTPVYDGAPAWSVIQDICSRCGIAPQDTNVYENIQLGQGVPFISFPQQSGSAILSQYTQVLPFLRIYETYANDWSLTVTNYGRTRFDCSLAGFIPGVQNGGIPSGLGFLNQMINNIIFTNPGNKALIFDTNYYYHPFTTPPNNRIWKWDLTTSLGNGLYLFGSDVALNTAMVYYRYLDTKVFFVDEAANLKYFDSTASSLVISTVGSFATGTKTQLVSACFYSNFCYIVLQDTSTGFQYLFVYDLTQAFSTVVSKGQLSHKMSNPTRSSGVTINSGVCADGKYWFYQWSATQITIWEHNGTPYTTTFSATVDVSYFSSLTIGGLNYQNSAFAYGGNTTSPRLLAIAAAPVNGSGFTNLEFWTLDIDAAYSNPAMNATKVGIILSDVGNTFVKIGLPGDGSVPFLDMASFVMNGSYVYMGDSEGNLWVQDTNKTFAPFQIGVSMPMYEMSNPPYQPFYQTMVWQMIGYGPGTIVRHCGPNPNGVDLNSQVWYSHTTPTNYFQGDMTAFMVQKGGFPTTPVASFDIGDNFMENLQLNVGNPTVNKVTIQPEPFALQSLSQVWAQGNDQSLIFPSNEKTTLSFQLNGTSSRGNALAGIQRKFICSYFTLIDNPALVTSIMITGQTYKCTFFAESDIGYLTIDATGNTQPVSITGATVQGQPATQPYTQAGYVNESDLTSQGAYQRIITQNIATALFNDTSFFQDILLNGKYGKPYVQGADMPWYPIIGVGQVIFIQDSVLGMALALFEVVEFNVDGFKTNFKANAVFATFNI